jgi:hypothetical protein
MDVDARVLRQPGAHFGPLMRGVIAHHQMQLNARVGAGDMLEEGQEFLAGMGRLAEAGDFKCRASSREDQCVIPSDAGGGVNVAAMIFVRSISRGRPARCSSSKPAIPRSWYLPRHARTVGTETPTSRAMREFGAPSAAISAERNTDTSRGMSTMLPSGSLFSTIYAGRRISLPGREAGLTKTKV